MGVRVASGVQKLPNAKEYLGTVANYIRDFPMVTSTMREITTSRARGSYADCYTTTNYFGQIMGSKVRFASANFKDDIEGRYARNVKAGWFPAGTTAKNILDHEMTHAMHANLASREASGSYDNRMAAVANRILNRASKTLGRTITRSDWGSVSDYARTNVKEFFAESVSDARANGSKANPISRAIYKAFKQEAKGL